MAAYANNMTTTLTSKLFAIAVAAVYVVAPADTQAVEIPAALVGDAGETRYTFNVLNTRISAFFELLGAVSNKKIELSDKVTARMQRQILTGSTAQIFDQISAEYELDWFYFNQVYYFSHDREQTSRVIRLGNLPAQEAIDVMGRGGILSGQLSHLVTANGRAIVLSGPPRQIAFAEVIIESIPDRAIETKSPAKIVVRRGVSISSETITTENKNSTSQNQRGAEPDSSSGSK